VPRIDPTARVADGARLADDVDVGPYCIVGPQVELRSGVRLVSHVNVAGVTVIGERTVAYAFASLGTPPQSVSYRGGATRLVVGADCIIRENVTMNTGTEDGGGITKVGDRGFFMCGSHVAHDCQVGNDVVFANLATIAGHCVVGDYVVMAGVTVAHQFSHIGSGAMLGGMSGIRSDVIPFGMVNGIPGRLTGINVVGMRRRKFSADSVRAVRATYRKLFFGEGEFNSRVEAVEKELGSDKAVAEIVAFIRSERQRRRLLHPRSHEEDDDE
jgi:UDP-N-acetylglucosamine acyltransferase